VLTVHPREQEQALRAARLREHTDAFTLADAQRVGVEGAHSPAVRVCGRRRSRSIGQPTTHLQHMLSAVARNLLRIDAWLNGTPSPSHPHSTIVLCPPYGPHGRTALLMRVRHQYQF
jgi:hypothetical protein